MFALATKIYRPEGVSVAHIAPAKVANPTCWNQASKLTVYGRTEAEQLANRGKLRSGQFTVTAGKRNGYFVLTAWPIVEGSR